MMAECVVGCIAVFGLGHHVEKHTINIFPCSSSPEVISCFAFMFGFRLNLKDQCLRVINTKLTKDGQRIAVKIEEEVSDFAPYYEFKLNTLDREEVTGDVVLEYDVIECSQS